MQAPAADHAVGGGAQAAFQALHRGRYWSDQPQMLFGGGVARTAGAAAGLGVRPGGSCSGARSGFPAALIRLEVASAA